jgi:hypothetical protein
MLLLIFGNRLMDDIGWEDGCEDGCDVRIENSTNENSTDGITECESESTMKGATMATGIDQWLQRVSIASTCAEQVCLVAVERFFTVDLKKDPHQCVFPLWCQLL